MKMPALLTEQVDAARLGQRRLEEPLGHLGAADVALDRDEARRRAQLGGGAVESAARAGVADDGVAALEERAHDAEANPAGSAGDDRGLVRRVHIRTSVRPHMALRARFY